MEWINRSWLAPVTRIRPRFLMRATAPVCTRLLHGWQECGDHDYILYVASKQASHGMCHIVVDTLDHVDQVLKERGVAWPVHLHLHSDICRRYMKHHKCGKPGSTPLQPLAPRRCILHAAGGWSFPQTAGPRRWRRHYSPAKGICASDTI